jgi:hypothetical protein
MRRGRTMKTKFVAAVIALGLLTVMTSTPANATAGPGFITLSFGRTQWQATAMCRPLPGAVELGQVADELAARGLAGNAIVVTTFAGESDRLCPNGLIAYASWADINALVSRGWSISSEGTYSRTIDSMTYDQAYQEICGSIAAFTSGIDPTGMWAWTGGKYYSAKYQRSIAATCFDWGRLYRTKINTPAIVTPPYTQRTWSLNGGWCAALTGSCYTTAKGAGATYLYDVPSKLAAYLSGQPDTWAVLQGYRFVTGSNSLGNTKWDCTSPDPNQHWSSRVEVYCWDDYVSILNLIAPGAIVTSPAAVAAAWGRNVA